ncbi:unnamed protein product [Sphagnum jensenii]|uniref:Uncharacterized protein n=1 Tax=Sphagnum jensenii TaxID=128206 RepID=A0ABP0WKU3_9BRYO
MATAVAKRLVPLLDRVLVEKVVPPTKSAGGILLPDSMTKVNSGVVVSVGPGGRTRDGHTVPPSVKEGDTVLLPEFGGTQINLGEKQFVLYRDDDILGVLEK